MSSSSPPSSAAVSAKGAPGPFFPKNWEKKLAEAESVLSAVNPPGKD